MRISALETVVLRLAGGIPLEAVTRKEQFPAALPSGRPSTGFGLFLLVPVLSEFFLPLMRRDLLFLSFLSAGHVGTPLSISSTSMHKWAGTVKYR